MIIQCTNIYSISLQDLLKEPFQCVANGQSNILMCKCHLWCPASLPKKKYSTGQQPLYNHLFSGQFQRILVLNPTVWGWLVCDPSPWPRRQPYSSETRLATDMAWPHSNWGAPHMARGSKNKVEWIRWIDGFFLIVLDIFFSNVQQFRKYLPASEVPKWYVTSIRPAAQPLGEAGYSLWRL